MRQADETFRALVKYDDMAGEDWTTLTMHSSVDSKQTPCGRKAIMQVLKQNVVYGFFLIGI